MLAPIFQYSLDSGRLPSIWKTANISPVFKKGNKALPENYRPVSLTCITCKLLEHIVLSHINSNLDHKILNNQHGFRRGFSCTTQLITTIHDLVTASNERVQVHAAVLDFSKAFDKVSHALLIGKLLGVGVDPSVVFWIQNFLTDRYQQVFIEGLGSSPLRVTSGVPQGSVLGPTLFLFYINDICLAIKHSTVRLFADDALLYTTINSVQDSRNFQADLFSLEEWAQCWKMIFNVDKCQIVDFNFSTISKVPANYCLYSKTLNVVKSFKYLGVVITDNLQWDGHIEAITSTAFRTLGMLRRVLFNAPLKVKRVAYLTLCRPILEYACEVWDPFLVKHISQLERVQRQAARFIGGIRGVCSVTKALDELEIDALSIRRKSARIRLLHNILSNDVHSSLSQSFDQLTAQQSSLHDHNTRSTTNSAPLAFSCNTTQFYNSFIPRTSRDMRFNNKF